MRIPFDHIRPAFGRLSIILSLLAVTAAELDAQSADAKWQQVMRGDGFVVDVDPASLMLTEGRVMSANFRMAYSKSESIGDAKFKSRIDKYEFDAGEGTYRIMESRYFDSDGREIPALASTAPQRSRVSTPTSVRFAAAARNLPPFGNWKVLTYKYGDGSGPKFDDGAELSRLKNRIIYVGFNGMTVGKARCDFPSFELRNMQDDEVEKRLAIRLAVLGIAAKQVRTLLIRCNSDTSLMFLPSEDQAVLLSDGIFLSLQREERDGFSLPTITIK